MSENETKFKVGNKVKIKGQFVPMTVSKVSTDMLGETFISVVWFNSQLELREAGGFPQDLFNFID